MKKIKSFFCKAFDSVKKSAHKIALMAAVPVLPLTSDTGVDVSSTVESIKGMLGDFSIANLILIIGGALALTVGLIIFWFAFRFIIRKVYGALKGKFGF